MKYIEKRKGDYICRYYPNGMVVKVLSPEGSDPPPSATIEKDVVNADDEIKLTIAHGPKEVLVPVTRKVDGKQVRLVVANGDGETTFSISEPGIYWLRFDESWPPIFSVKNIMLIVKPKEATK